MSLSVPDFLLDNGLKPCECCLIFETIFPSYDEDINTIKEKLFNLVAKGYCEHVEDAISEELKKPETKDGALITVEKLGKYYTLNISNSETDILICRGGIGTLHLLVLLHLTHCVRYWSEQESLPYICINSIHHNVHPFKIATLHKNRSMVKFLLVFPFGCNFNDVESSEQYFSYIVSEHLTKNFVKSSTCTFKELRRLFNMVLRMLNDGKREFQHDLVCILKKGWQECINDPSTRLSRIWNSDYDINCLDMLLITDKEVTKFIREGNKKITRLFTSSRLESSTALLSYAVRYSKWKYYF